MPERVAAAAPAAAEKFERARILHQQGSLAAAHEAYQQVIAAAPDHLGALIGLGMLAGRSNDLPRALRYFERAVAVEPDNAAAQCNLGLTLKVLDRAPAALACFDAALKLDGRNAVAHYGRAETCRALGRLDEALASYDLAMMLNPGFVDALYGRGVVLQQVARLDESIAGYDQVLRIKPDHADAHTGKAFALSALGRRPEALGSCERALALNPHQAALHVLRGDLLRSLERIEASLESYDQALRLQPDSPQAHCNRGAALMQLDRVDEALASIDRAIEIEPNVPEAHFHRGYILRLSNRFDAAVAAYRTAGTMAPNFEFLPGNQLEASLQVCNWSDYGALVRQIAAGLENGTHVSHPLIVMALTHSAALQQQAARIWAQFACPANGALGPIARRARPRKLTVAYISADFHEHPIGRLLAELIEIHDRSRFEVIAISLGPRTQDEFQERLIRAFDRFVEARGRSTLEIASLARRLNVDIAVDLGGYSTGARANIFALRAAPVQVSYLGYLGTLGTSYMDYIVGDHTVIAPATESRFSEKIIYMPDTHQVNDRQRRIADKVFTRQELRLPATGFVFCCFNSSYKVSPATFAGWMRILTAAPGSVLLLNASHSSTENNLRTYAARHGVDPQRLIFGERLPPAEYLARYRAADLFLDTFPYTAGTTASDALWAGLPLLTLTGESFASRTAASLLSALGVPELIASTQQDYERLAVEFASNPERLAAVRAKVQKNRLVGPLFDTPRFARHLESAFTAIYDRYEQGLPPAHVRL